MFFSKKKHKGSIPTDQIKQMSSRGMSDKQIIKKLKKEGYSYDEIERAMLDAVKDGVGEEDNLGTRFSGPPSYTAPAGQATIDDLYQTPTQAPMPMPEMRTDQPTEELNPEALIEDLIEGVIEEKWEKFNDKIKKHAEDLERIETTIKQFDQKVQNLKQQPVTKEFELRADVLNNNIEDLEARIGGLEKAFKQFLPSLTRNIESLSVMIHDLKAKTEGPRDFSTHRTHPSQEHTTHQSNHQMPQQRP